MDELVMLHTHVDFRVDTTTLNLPVPVITIYGNTMDSMPICVEVQGFMPYLYAQQIGQHPKHVDPAALEAILRTGFTKGKCLGVEEILKKSIYGYAENECVFYKITFNSPFVLRSAKAFLESGSVRLNGESLRFKIYESGFPFALRFMNDLEITGMSYLKIKKYTVVRKAKEPGSRLSSMIDRTLIISTTADFIEPLPISGDYIKLLPLKILSFDIECICEGSGFPSPASDPVIQIGNTIQRFGTDENRRDIFCLGETADIPGANVHWYETEEELLVAWAEFWHREDPDIVIGYNIKGFDFPYLLDRAEALGIADFAKLGRTNATCKVVTKQLSSSAFGAIDAKDIAIDGRFVCDLYHIIRRDFKLRSYSLNAVSFHFLNEQKEDVSYLAMHELQRGDRETRRRIASYCLHDTYLPMRLFDKLNILINHCELARATHVPIEYFSTRGSAIKVLSQIYAEARKCGFLIPDLDPSLVGEGFEGAFVMEPTRGFYSQPIAVLDFSSLYPSIIISKNMCYTTLLPKNSTLASIVSPTGDRFCASDVAEGLLPRILRSLLSARKETRKLLKEATDPFLKRSLDGRQLALKICANSIYGFTGSATGQLPCLPISQSTTAFGRDMIMKTKQLIESHFNSMNEFPYDAQVIYGDTDSVMIKFAKPESPVAIASAEMSNMDAVFTAAKDIATLVSSTFEKPISLEFEKVYYPYLLMNKKRYAGLVYTNPDRPGKIDTKGIETVRRDNCELVKNVIQTCLNKILMDRDVEGAVHYAKETIRNIYTEKIDLSQLVISKTYTKPNYANKQTHTELVEKLKKRGITVGIGERIPYVIVQRDKKSLACEKSEDPVYVLENSLPIDKEYYIEQQLSKPLHRLFEPIMDNVSSLFHGEHTKIITQGVSVQGPLNKFVTAAEECVGCRKIGKIICEYCLKDFLKHYISLQKQHNQKTTQYNECWVECQRCQGSVLNEVLCINRICPIWYKRTKIKKELGPLEQKLQKLKNFTW